MAGRNSGGFRYSDEPEARPVQRQPRPAPEASKASALAAAAAEAAKGGIADALAFAAQSFLRGALTLDRAVGKLARLEQHLDDLVRLNMIQAAQSQQPGEFRKGITLADLGTTNGTEVYENNSDYPVAVAAKVSSAGAGTLELSLSSSMVGSDELNLAIGFSTTVGFLVPPGESLFAIVTAGATGSVELLEFVPYKFLKPR